MAYINGQEVLFSAQVTSIGDGTSVKNTDYSFAYGKENYAGYMCHKVESYDESTLTLTLDSSASTLAVNDVISVDGGVNYPYCATITTISGNTITVDKAIVSPLDGTTPMNPASETHLLYVDGKPATGNNALAEGQIALGLNNHAIAKGTAALGRQNYASGGYSFAAGRQNSAANYASALGQNNKAMGMFSHAVGSKNTASGIYTTALGLNNEASDYCAAAIGGASNKATKRYALAIGNGCEASGLASFAGGQKSVASGYGSFAFGMPDNGDASTKAEGDCSFAFGNGANTKGDNAVAIGRSANALGQETIAIGYDATANAEKGSFAVGYQVTSSGERAMAIGNNCDALGNNSLAVGAWSKAVGDGHTALGWHTTTNNPDMYGQVALGSNNDAENDGDFIFVIGNGDPQNKSTAFKVMHDGSAEVQAQGTTDNSVVTKAYVDALIARIEALEAALNT